MQTTSAAHAESADTSGVPTDVSVEAEAVPRAAVESFSIVAPPNVLDAASRLALSSSVGLGGSGSTLLSPTPKSIMSSNTKTVVIVAIIAGAVLILVGAIALGKPFKKL